MKMIRTSLARTREQHSLEPCREVVHDREVARRDEEVTDPNDHRDLLPEQERSEDRLRRDLELDHNEEDSKDDGRCKGPVDRWRVPLS